MKNFTITKARFLEFFYDCGQDSEIESLKEDLAEKVIDNLKDFGVSTITVEDIFNGCNKESIQFCFLEQYKDLDDVEGELSDLDENEYTITLI